MKTQEDLLAWMEELRQRAGLSQEAVADAMYGSGAGAKARRNISRWETSGKGISAINLVRFLTAVGVRLEPAPPEEIPKAVNEELRILRQRQEELAKVVTDLATEAVKRAEQVSEALTILKDIQTALRAALQAENRSARRAGGRG